MYAATTKSLDASGRDALIEHCRSTFDCEVAAKNRLNRLDGCGASSLGTSAAVPCAGRSNGTNGAGLQK